MHQQKDNEDTCLNEWLKKKTSKWTDKQTNKQMFYLRICWSNIYCVHVKGPIGSILKVIEGVFLHYLPWVSKAATVFEFDSYCKSRNVCLASSLVQGIKGSPGRGVSFWVFTSQRFVLLASDRVICSALMGWDGLKRLEFSLLIMMHLSLSGCKKNGEDSKAAEDKAKENDFSKLKPKTKFPAVQIPKQPQATRKANRPLPTNH